MIFPPDGFHQIEYPVITKVCFQLFAPLQQAVDTFAEDFLRLTKINGHFTIVNSCATLYSDSTFI